MVALEALADHPELRIDVAHRLEQLGIALLRDQPADHRDHRRRLVRTQFAPQRRARGIVGRCRKETGGIGAVADRLDHAAAAQRMAARGCRVLGGLREQNIGRAAAETFEADEQRPLPGRHAVVKIEPVRGVDDRRHAGAARGKPADQRRDGRMHMHDVEILLAEELHQLAIGAPVLERIVAAHDPGRRDTKAFVAHVRDRALPSLHTPTTS